MTGVAAQLQVITYTSVLTLFRQLSTQINIALHSFQLPNVQSSCLSIFDF